MDVVKWTPIAKLSLAAWGAMLLFSFVHFSFMWGFRFQITTFGFGFLSPLILLGGTFALIRMDKMEFMLFPLGFHLLFAFSGTGFNVLSFINFCLIGLLVLLFALVVIKQLPMIPGLITDAVDNVMGKLPITVDVKILTIVAGACFALYAVLILGFYGFGALFGSGTIRNLSFFAGVAMLGFDSFRQ